MPDNDAISKADLQNAVQNAVTQIIAEMDRRFAEAQHETNKRFDATNKRFDATDKRFDTTDKRFDTTDKRFQQADRERQAFREDMKNRFYEIEGKIMNRFDLAQEHTDESVAALGREVTTKLDKQAGVTDTFRVEQMAMGVVQDQLRADLEATQEKEGAEIKNLKRRVTVLEEAVLPSSAGNA
jgi:hypothetical protein